MNVRTAVIPAAGMGTRFLPISKSTPKEMLPIVDKPVIQFVVEEAIASGLDDIVIITSALKPSIERHFTPNPEMETFLAAAGKQTLLDELRLIAKGAKITFLNQETQAGLGDAVRIARDHCAGRPFAVLLGDCIIDSPTPRPGLRELLDIAEARNASAVAVRRVPREWVTRYGIVDGVPEPQNPSIYRLNQLIEKPAVDKAPTDLAIAGRYVFTPDIFEEIDATATGLGGELHLTDAMNSIARRRPMFAYAWNAKRYDIGNRIEYIKCFLDFALRRPDTADAIKQYIATL
jgi:UTP--glucose-1-phosphate uridylyltransferase